VWSVKIFLFSWLVVNVRAKPCKDVLATKNDKFIKVTKVGVCTIEGATEAITPTVCGVTATVLNKDEILKWNADNPINFYKCLAIVGTQLTTIKADKLVEDFVKLLYAALNNQANCPGSPTVPTPTKVEALNESEKLEYEKKVTLRKVYKEDPQKAVCKLLYPKPTDFTEICPPPSSKDCKPVLYDTGFCDKGSYPKVKKPAEIEVMEAKEKAANDELVKLRNLYEEDPRKAVCSLLRPKPTEIKQTCGALVPKIVNPADCVNILNDDCQAKELPRYPDEPDKKIAPDLKKIYPDLLVEMKRKEKLFKEDPERAVCSFLYPSLYNRTKNNQGPITPGALTPDEIKSKCKDTYNFTAPGDISKKCKDKYNCTTPENISETCKDIPIDTTKNKGRIEAACKSLNFTPAAECEKKNDTKCDPAKCDPACNLQVNWTLVLVFIAICLRLRLI